MSTISEWPEKPLSEELLDEIRKTAQAFIDAGRTYHAAHDAYAAHIAKAPHG
jgi:hypothetical protein